MRISLHHHPTPGFSVRITVAGENCNITGEYFERGSMSAQNVVRVSNINPRILHNKRRVLWSPSPARKLSQGALAPGRKRMESLQSRLSNLNSASSTPVPPRQQCCQFWPISTEWKWASNACKQTKKQCMKGKFPTNKGSPESTATGKRWNAKKLSSSHFRRQFVKGARSKDERSKGGKPPLVPTPQPSALRQQQILQTLWRTLNSQYSYSKSVLKQRCPGQLNKLNLSPDINKLTGIHQTEFIYWIKIRCQNNTYFPYATI